MGMAELMAPNLTGRRAVTAPRPVAKIGAVRVGTEPDTIKPPIVTKVGGGPGRDAPSKSTALTILAPLLAEA